MWYHLSHPRFSLLRSSGLLLDSVYMEFLEVQMPCLTVKTAVCYTLSIIRYRNPFFAYFSHGTSILT